MIDKPCELCKEIAVRGERYCKNHRARKLAEMEASGYLTPKYLYRSQKRTREMMEVQHETKFGTQHG